MKRKLLSRHGGITLFLCILLSSVIVIETVFVSGSYRRKQEVELTEAVSHQAEQILSQFDRDAMNWYGIYGMNEVEAEQAVFDRMTENIYDASFSYELTDELDEHAVETAIIDFMKLRGIAFEGSGLLERMNLSLSSLKGVNWGSGEGVASWMPTFQEYIQNRNNESISCKLFRASCKIAGLGDELDAFDEFVDEVSYIWERDSSLSLEFGDSSAFVSLFDPSGMESVIGIFDSLMDTDLPSALDRLLVNEYAAFSFDSRVDEYTTDDGMEEECNIVGIPFSEMHDEQHSDLEYLLIGSESDSVNKLMSFELVFGTRLILDLSAFIMDDERMELAMTIAEITSLMITLLTLGLIYVDPTVIQYTIIFMMAFVRAMIDAMDLIQGESVTLFYNDTISDSLGNFSETTYRDYFRVFLLFVPEDTLLRRMTHVIKRDCGTLYTGVSATGTLRGDEYQVDRRYELYETDQ